MAFRTGFNLVNAAIVCAILESISGLEPSSVITEPKYLKSVHLVNQYWTVPRQTEEEVGRKHQGMDRSGVCQVPEGSGEWGKMEETGCQVICGAPTTLVVKG